MHVVPPVARPTRSTSLTDAGAVALALATAVGAWRSAAVPISLGLLVVVAALVRRRPLVLVVGAALLASGLGARATDGLAPPPPAPYEGEVTLLGDPVVAFSGVRVEARAGGRRVELQARGRAAGVVADRLAGERVVVRGRVGPLPDAVRDRLARRHVTGRLVVEEVGTWRPGSPVHRLANGLRRTLVAGAAPLGEDRALFLGMVVGDDRGQPVVVADDFKAAGLTHLLAVSGQNVAFVLVLAGPALRRLGLASRWVVTLALIGFFALLTRFEPSVLRASAMAAVACTAHGVGRPAPRIRTLALAATAVLLLDPFLVRSIGFLLSAGASLGIILLARPIAVRLPGPRWLAELAGVTLAAQVGVAPVLIPVFDGIPLASLPANVLAVPAAGPLMMWGLTGGMAAGVLGPPFDGWLHLPTDRLVGWVAAVARWGASLPLGSLGAGQVMALGVVVVAGWAARRWRPEVALPAAAAVAAAVLVVPAVAPVGALAGVDGGSGATVWRDGGAVVVVFDEPWLPGVLAELREAQVDRIDVLLLRRGGRQVAGTVMDLRSRIDVRLVLAPEGHRVRVATVPPVGSFAIGTLVVDVAAVDPSLDVTVRSAGAEPP